mmetsp:Transcript_72531/g.201146  ORF Transcript_72531/g.201146 Transcript_72531/m.201146 type:complete len:235 (+) Transcript_72531:649-1353(+)
MHFGGLDFGNLVLSKAWPLASAAARGVAQCAVCHAPLLARVRPGWIGGQVHGRIAVVDVLGALAAGLRGLSRRCTSLAGRRCALRIVRGGIRHDETCRGRQGVSSYRVDDAAIRGCFEFPDAHPRGAGTKSHAAVVPWRASIGLPCGASCGPEGGCPGGREKIDTARGARGWKQPQSLVAWIQTTISPSEPCVGQPPRGARQCQAREGRHRVPQPGSCSTHSRRQGYQRTRQSR